MSDSKQKFIQRSDDTTTGVEGDMTNPQVITSEEQTQILPGSGSAILTHQVNESGGDEESHRRGCFSWVASGRA